MLVDVIESAVTSEGCNHTSSGNGFAVVADAGAYSHAYRGVPSESFHGPSSVPPTHSGASLLTNVCGGSPNGPHPLAAPAEPHAVNIAKLAKIETTASANFRISRTLDS